MRRRGLIRSGLLRTAGRTALIAGTATAVSGHVAGRQRAALAQRSPEAPAGDGEDLVSRLHRLADLKAMGVLTDKEFAAAKSKLLND
jgi:hypothetical protein